MNKKIISYSNRNSKKPKLSNKEKAAIAQQKIRDKKVALFQELRSKFNYIPYVSKKRFLSDIAKLTSYKKGRPDTIGFLNHALAFQPSQLKLPQSQKHATPVANHFDSQEEFIETLNRQENMAEALRTMFNCVDGTPTCYITRNEGSYFTLTVNERDAGDPLGIDSFLEHYIERRYYDIRIGEENGGEEYPDQKGADGGVQLRIEFDGKTAQLNSIIKTTLFSGSELKKLSLEIIKALKISQACLLSQEGIEIKCDGEKVKVPLKLGPKLQGSADSWYAPEFQRYIGRINMSVEGRNRMITQTEHDFSDIERRLESKEFRCVSDESKNIFAKYKIRGKKSLFKLLSFLTNEIDLIKLKIKASAKDSEDEALITHRDAVMHDLAIILKFDVIPFKNEGTDFGQACSKLIDWDLWHMTI